MSYLILCQNNATNQLYENDLITWLLIGCPKRPQQLPHCVLQRSFDVATFSVADPKTDPVFFKIIS